MTRLGLPIKNMASWQHQLLTASTQMFISRKTLLIKKVRHGAKASGFNLANRQHCPLDLIA